MRNAKLYDMYYTASLLKTWPICRCNTLDRNLIFSSFSRLIAIVTNTNENIYSREEQILAIMMIVLNE